MRKPRFSNIIRIFKLLGHASLIMFFLVLPFAFINQTPNPVKPFNPVYTLNYWIYFFSFIGYFYSFTYYIIPRYLLTKKYWKFGGLLLLIFIFFGLLKPFERVFDDILEIMTGRPLKPYDPFLIDFLTNFVFIMLTALGLSIQVVKQWRQSERRTLQAETEKTQAVVEKKTAELSFLKAQINPHFLFNTLNTIYSLIRTQNPLAGDAVLKLSHIMRFVTDDASSDFVSLEKEVAFVTDFVKLHQLQLGKKVDLDFSVTGNTKNKKIAPLILMTYLENVFKYGISNHEMAPIMIRLNITENGLDFFCQNRIFATPRATQRTGIGLTNTKKRLEHLYPGTHTLNISHTSGLYTVTLTLPA